MKPIRVRLTDAEEWPQHNVRRSSVKRWKAARGMEIVLGAPVKPNHDWKCETDLVWPVLQWDKEKASVTQEGHTPYVCRHQIQAGD